MATPTRDQFAGSLIGPSLGDALGFVVEGHGPEACRAYVEEVLKSGRAGDARDLTAAGAGCNNTTA